MWSLNTANLQNVIPIAFNEASKFNEIFMSLDTDWNKSIGIWNNKRKNTMQWTISNQI
jgi:hypothetical protein